MDTVLFCYKESFFALFCPRRLTLSCSVRKRPDNTSWFCSFFPNISRFTLKKTRFLHQDCYSMLEDQNSLASSSMRWTHRGWGGGGWLWQKDSNREYYMIYRGPGFLVVVWFGSSPTPSPLSRQQVRPAATHRKTKKERQLGDGREGVGWVAESVRPQESLVLYKSSILCGK